MDYEAEDKGILRKVTIDALKRVGATITRNDVTGYLKVGCDDKGELELALQGAEIMRREAAQGFAARNYYNIECALRNKLKNISKS